MGKATGVFLILTGISTAALVLPALDKDAERQLADAVRMATGAVQQVAPVVSPAAPAANRPADPSRAVAATMRIAPPDVPSNAPPSRSGSPAVVLAGADAAPVLLAPPQAVIRNSGATPSRAADSQSREILTRDIQRELKRVGCYSDDVSGEWDSATRRGMKAFMDRINAGLPVDEPDHILRTMVQGHPGNACGAGCPSGQTANQQGRCLPSGTVAQNAVKVPSLVPEPRHREPLVAIAPTPPKASPSVPESNSGLRPVVPKPAWETSVTVAAAPATAPSTPLNTEGRMAMGGPVSAAASAAPAEGKAGVRNPKTAASSAITTGSSNPVIVPGAIAALGGGSAIANPNNRLASLAPPHGDLRGRNAEHMQPPVQSIEQAVVPAAPQRSKDTKDAKDREREEAAREAARDRRKAAAVYKAPPPEKYKFPAPSYNLGAKEPKYLTSYQKPDNKPFSRLFEKITRDGGR